MKTIILYLLSLLLISTSGVAAIHLTKGGGSPGGYVYGSTNTVYLTGGDFTFFIQIKFDVAPNAGPQQIVWSRNDSGGLNSEYTQYMLTDGTSTFYCGASGVGILTGTTVVSDTNYHTYLVTRSGTTWTDYIDGVQDATTVSATSCTDDSSTIIPRIGVNVSNNFSMNGTVAEAAWWNRVLSAGEIQALSMGVVPNNIGLLNLTFYTPLNQRSGTGIGNAFAIPDLSQNSTLNAPDVGTFNGNALTADHCPCGRPAPQH